MNDGYRRGLYSAWDEAVKQYPKDAARRRQRFQELLRVAQGLEPDATLEQIRKLPKNKIVPLLSEVQVSS